MSRTFLLEFQITIPKGKWFRIGWSTQKIFQIVGVTHLFLLFPCLNLYCLNRQRIGFKGTCLNRKADFFLIFSMGTDLGKSVKIFPSPVRSSASPQVERGLLGRQLSLCALECFASEVSDARRGIHPGWPFWHPKSSHFFMVGTMIYL